ncbi:GNAT family N-acetyltransferase [Gemmobacter serpentinus]|uniref:GNAT family N-acetyltransferase n=1 Tax=Gemmobacter serpentinus TaxID=2652247 RepID=UPI00124E02D7|nr:N-acetyltransferase [Gemmobacter serpentinus]
MILRDETAADVDAIAALVTAAFTDAEHSDGNEAAIVADLRAGNGLLLSLLAEDTGALLGHIAASAVTVGGEPGWACIAPVSVAPAAQRRGVGSALMTAAMARLQALGTGGGVILGDPDYYRRFGFVADGRRRIAGVPQDYVLSHVLTTDPPGDVGFHPAFGMA